MLRKSSQPLLSDKLLQHDDVQRSHGLLLDDVLQPRADVLLTGAKLLCSRVERQCGSGRRAGSSPRRLRTLWSRELDDRPGS
jgi:hypothetical protein